MLVKFLKRAQRDRIVLAAVYPHLFSLDNPVPLAIGIREQLLDEFPGITGGRIHCMLAWLTKRRAYLAVCTPGAVRYGLKGPDGEVAASAAAFASKGFLRRNARAREPERWTLDSAGRWQPPAERVAA